MGNYLPNYLTKAILRPWGQTFESIQSRDAEEKPSQSQFEAEKPLRRRCCRTISESSGRLFHVPFLCMVLEIWANMTRSVL
jgi:hypothetical protein